MNPIKITVRGIDITVSSAAEAAQLVRELTDLPRQKPKLFRLPLTSRRSPPINGTDAQDGTLGFLTTIANAGAQGVMAEDLMKVLHVTKPKGVGGRSVKINNELKALGFIPSQVFGKSRTAEGRIWKPRSKMGDAIEAVKRSRG